MWRKNVFVQAVSLALSVCTLSACQPDTKPASNVKFNVPQRILQARAVDKSQLSPTVKLSDGRIIQMEPAVGDAWSGTINVAPNNTYNVTVEWHETLPDGTYEGAFDNELLLATWFEQVEVDADGAVRDVLNEDYNYEHDADRDGIDNLEERQNGTNPFDYDEVPAGGDDNETTGDTTDPTDASTTVVGTSSSGADTDDSDATDITDATDEGGTTVGTDSDEPTDTGTTTDVTDGDSTTGSTETAGDTAGTTDDGETDSDSDTDGSTDGSTDGTTDGSIDDIQPRATVLIPSILPADAPSIDGLGVTALTGSGRLTGEWANAVQSDDSGAGLWIDSLMILTTAGVDTAVDGDKLHRWAAMHDGVNLYVLVLTDDTGPGTSDSDRIWQDDSIELFIDGNNSKSTVWDNDDFHIQIALLQSNSDDANDDGANRTASGPNTSTTLPDFSFATGPGEGPDGIRAPNFEQDVYEISIPLASVGITLGEPFGFELQIDDDDNEGGRDAKWGWYHPSRNGFDVDLTYQNPSVMGTVTLEE